MSRFMRAATERCPTAPKSIAQSLIVRRHMLCKGQVVQHMTHAQRAPKPFLMVFRKIACSEVACWKLPVCKTDGTQYVPYVEVTGGALARQSSGCCAPGAPEMPLLPLELPFLFYPLVD